MERLCRLYGLVEEISNGIQVHRNNPLDSIYCKISTFIDTPRGQGVCNQTDVVYMLRNLFFGRVRRFSEQGEG